MGKSAARHLDNNAGCIAAGTDTVFDAAATDKLRQKSTDKGISGTIGVDKFLFGKLSDCILDDFAVAGDDGGFGTLCDDDAAWTETGLLWE